MADFYNTQIEIYKDTSLTTKVDIINARIDPATLSELKGHGAGSFKVSKNDPKVRNNPTLLAYRNYVKIRFNGAVIGGFIIQTKKTVIVGAGEEQDEMWEVSGEGPRAWTKDASVYPAKGLKADSGETRYFNFSTERGSWYNPSEWNFAIMGWQWNNVSNGAPKGHAPANWPDAKYARWMWSLPNSWNDPKGFNYFRHEFTVPGAAGTTKAYAFFIAADDAAEVYVDGEQKAVIEMPGWHDTTRVEMELAPGPHVIGVKAYNDRGPGEILTSLFSYGDPAAPSPATLINHSGMADTWRVLGYPAQEPGWTTGDILLTLLNEARGRGIRFANNFTPTFTSTVDSGGVPWSEPVPWSFDVGATYEEVVMVAEELGCDIFVDPDTLNMHVWGKRGYDRTVAGGYEHPVIFAPGKNLLSAEETGQAEIANLLLLRTPEGWSEVEPILDLNTQSKSMFGRIETQMSTRLTSVGASKLVQELFRQKALPEVSATFDIVPVLGTIPFVDFNVGDWVSAPGDVPGVLESRRVMSIAFTEDRETGYPLYALEFDTIFKDRQEELERWLARMSNSSALSGSFTAVSNLPPVVVPKPPGSPGAIIPDAPTGLTVSSVGKWLPDGGSSSDYGLTWNAVITGKGFGVVEVEKYEVWGRLNENSESALITTVFDTFAYLKNYRPGDNWVFKVRAITRFGGPGDFSTEVALVAEAPVAVLLAPTAPILTSSFGSVNVGWDGLVGTSTPVPNYVRYIGVRRRAVGTTTWKVVGNIPANSTLQNFVDNPGSPGTSWEYRLYSVDGYGKTSPNSAISTITVSGVNSGDIVGGLASNNLVANGSFEDGLVGWVKTSGVAGSTAQVRTDGSFSGAKYLRMARPSEAAGTEQENILAQAPDYYIPISAVGEYGYFISAKGMATSSAATKAFSLRAYWWKADKTTPASTEFSTVVDSVNLDPTTQYFTGRVYPPDDARFLQVALVMTRLNSTIYLDDVVAREAITPNMLGENVILAEHMSAGSVTTNALQANSVTADILAAEAVLADNIKAGEIQVSHLSSTVGSSLNISSNASINLLINRANGLQAGLNDTNDTVSQLTTYYSFGPDGAEIGKSDSAFKLMLKNDRIEIQENGIVVSYWDSGRMVVPSFVGEEVVLGNHKLEKYSTGTVVRAI